MNLDRYWAGRLGGRVWAASLAVWFALLLVLGYGAHLRGLQASSAQRAAQGAQWLVEHEDKASRALRIPAATEEVTRLEQALLQADHALLQESGMNRLLQSVTGLGRGLVFEQLTLLPVEQGAVPLQLNVQGSYLALQSFLAALGTLPARVTPHELRLAPVEAGNGQLRLEMRLKAWQAHTGAPVELRSPSAPPAAANNRQDPFRQPVVTGGLLEQYSVEQMEWVGHLRDRTVRLALVRVAGRLHPVREGDVLGTEQARLVKVEDGQAVLALPLSADAGNRREHSRTIRWSGSAKGEEQ